MLGSLFRMVSRIRSVFQTRSLDRDLNIELESHVALRAEDYIRRGMAPADAFRTARIELGGLTQLREAHRETRSLPFVETLLQDLRYTFRMLRNNPGFAMFSVLIVGLGIGASTTVFSVVNTLLIRPLPFTDAARLVWIGNLADDGVNEWNLQVGHFVDLRKQSKSFSDLTRALQANIIFRSLRLTAAGILIGAAASSILAQAMRGLLFGITTSDVPTFVGMAVILAMVAAVAGYLPARRASRIDPILALRAD